MNDLSGHDPNSVRVGRLFADLMLTLAEDGVRGAEAVTLIRPLSAQLLTVDLRAQPPRLCTESIVAGLTLVAGELAEMLAAERREHRGPQNSCVAQVWRDLLAETDSPGAAASQAGDATE